ncbi:DUF6428 family protein [Mucilaginibacter litoreus]|uniref:DUF6428 family protein n=1 Tax=Mucilaginibacter litoreus TaxID=1048221 RepID=A0ABW3AQF6_9SPHI
METLKWLNFKQHLQSDAQLMLQFQYADNKWIDASYHITEIKQAPVTSVDCGGVLNNWTEIIVQIWEPEISDQDRAMTTAKALSIINLVEQKITLDDDAIVKIEFGNTQFDTRQMLPKSITAENGNLIIDLRPDTVQCKAIERGGSCGTDNQGQECCVPAADVKPKIRLKNISADALCCVPGSGCC